MESEGELPVHKEDQETFIMFSVIILEHLWWFQNRLAHREEAENLESSMQTIWKRFNEFKSSRHHDCDHRPMLLNREYQQSWSRPPPSFIKINTDAAMHKSGSCLALVACNDRGNLLTIQSFKLENNITKGTKVEAILMAMQATVKVGWNNILIESDALSAIECLTSRHTKSRHWIAEQ